MAITPDAGPLELAGPKATFAGAGFRLLAAVVIGRNGKARRDHPCAQVAAAGAADRQNTAEAVMTVGLTVERFSGHQRDQQITRLTTARPIEPLGIGTALVELGSIDTQQANAVDAEVKTVAITDPGAAGKRGIGRIQPGRQQGAGQQDGDRQQRAKPSAKRSMLNEV